jgi:NACalpha-BTF3-like transcription factor
VLPRTIAGLSNEAAAFAKGFLGVAGVSILAQFGLDAGKASVSLERTQAVLQNVLGSQQRYNEVAKIAATNQQLLGGSLESNLATLQQFAFIANRTGGSIEELNRVAQLLAAVNPAEGLEGAGFALSELAAGDVTSIVERFNLSRQAVTALKNEAGGDLAVLLAGVTELLAEQGITSETLAAALTENSLAYRGLAAEAEKAKIKVGEFAAEAGRLPALGLTELLRDFNAIASIGDQVAASQAQIVATADSFEAYQAAAARVNTALAKLGTPLPPLRA